MIYYIFDFKKNTYIVDIDFFINIISKEVAFDSDNIDVLLRELKIRKLDLPEFDFLPDYCYIYDNNRVKEIKLTEELINDMKQHFIEFIYDRFKKGFNIQITSHYAENIAHEMHFYVNNPTYFEDKELCYLDILNSGVEKKIGELEKFLSLIYGSKRFFHNFLCDVKYTEESLIKSTSIPEIIFNVIIYIDKIKYDLNSMNLIKQLIYEDGE